MVKFYFQDTRLNLLGLFERKAKQDCFPFVQPGPEYVNTRGATMQVLGSEVDHGPQILRMANVQACFNYAT